MQLCVDNSMKHLPISKLTEKDKKRFWSNVDISDKNKCWEWTNYLTDGYGRIKIQNKMY